MKGTKKRPNYNLPSWFSENNYELSFIHYHGDPLARLVHRDRVVKEYQFVPSYTMVNEDALEDYHARYKIFD